MRKLSPGKSKGAHPRGSGYDHVQIHNPHCYGGPWPDPRIRGWSRLHSHAAIAMPRHGPPFGVVHLSIWARELAEHGKRRDAAARTKDPIEIKESQKWIDGMWGAEAALS